jgi:uncharacterized protein
MSLAGIAGFAIWYRRNYSRTMSKARDIVWQSLAWPSTVSLRFEQNKNRISGNGFAVGKTDQHNPFVYRYIVTLTPQWIIRTISILSLLDDRKLDLKYASEKWYSNDIHIPEFDSVPFFDISISPFTNSIPLKQLVLKTGQPKQIDVVYFDENLFSLRKVQQTYTKINTQTYLYQDMELPNFKAKFTIDEDGLIEDYQLLFKKV